MDPASLRLKDAAVDTVAVVAVDAAADGVHRQAIHTAFLLAGLQEQKEISA